MLKTPAVAYYSHKIDITPKTELIQELKDAPISDIDLEFMLLIIERKSYKEIASHFSKSEARVYQWKRKLFEKLSVYDASKVLS